MRLRTDFWIAVLRRRAEAAGAYVSIARSGAAEAGAVFVTVRGGDGGIDLYGPAPQSVFDPGRPADRLFSLLSSGQSDAQISDRVERETRFDPDLWLVDIEDRESRSFLDVVAGPG